MYCVSTEPASVSPFSTLKATVLATTTTIAATAASATE